MAAQMTIVVGLIICLTVGYTDAYYGSYSGGSGSVFSEGVTDKEMADFQAKFDIIKDRHAKQTVKMTSLESKNTNLKSKYGNQQHDIEELRKSIKLLKKLINKQETDANNDIVDDNIKSIQNNLAGVAVKEADIAIEVSGVSSAILQKVVGLSNLNSRLDHITAHAEELSQQSIQYVDNVFGKIKKALVKNKVKASL